MIILLFQLRGNIFFRFPPKKFYNIDYAIDTFARYDVLHQPLPEQARLLRTPELVVRKVEDLAPGPVEKKRRGQTRRSALLSGAAP